MRETRFGSFKIRGFSYNIKARFEKTAQELIHTGLIRK